MAGKREQERDREPPATLSEQVDKPLDPQEEAEKIKDEGEPGGANFA